MRVAPSGRRSSFSVLSTNSLDEETYLEGRRSYDNPSPLTARSPVTSHKQSTKNSKANSVYLNLSNRIGLIDNAKVKTVQLPAQGRSSTPPVQRAGVPSTDIERQFVLFI
eukprot:c15327_g1_i2.p1 GENE.c15327_g1_i2~~c15327_g1_i2.p1  ORF type:complete len:110 (-),score=24.98 c15327_g1_i2:135-464(-)